MVKLESYPANHAQRRVHGNDHVAILIQMPIAVTLNNVTNAEILQDFGVLCHELIAECGLLRCTEGDECDLFHRRSDLFKEDT